MKALINAVVESAYNFLRALTVSIVNQSFGVVEGFLEELMSNP